MKKSNICFLLPLLTGVIMVITSCNDSGNTTNTTSTTTTNTTTVQADTSIEKQTDFDKGLKVSKELYEVGKDLVAEKKQNDSIRQSNKPRMWVYKIGESFEKEEPAAEASDKFKGLHNICVFKKAKREYYIIKDDVLSYEQLTDSLGSFKKQLVSIEGNSYRIEIIDLSVQCSSKKEPKTSAPIRYKVDGKKGTVDCKICD